MKRFCMSAGIAVAAALVASPAFAIDVSKSVETSAAPADVWSAIGDFCGIKEWHPAVQECTLEERDGASVRTLTLPDGAELVEELVSRDEDAMAYTYRILEGPLPVANYESTISVSASGNGSTIGWSGTFDAEGASDAEATDVIGGIYDAGLASLKDKTGGM